MSKIINFFDGYTTGSTPTQIGVSNLQQYADDASFEADNTGSPIAGNIYYNTTDNRIRYYTTIWVELADEGDILTLTTNLTNAQNQADTNTTDITNLTIATNDFISTKGQASGLAPLDATQKVPAVNLPSYVDDVEEYADFASLPVIGESGKIYITLDDGKQYRWSGTVYAEVSPSDVNSVNGQTGIVTLDKTHIGLTNVTDDSQLKRSAGDMNTFTEKTEPNKEDIVLIEDSEDSYNKKTVKLDNLLGGGGTGGINYLGKNSDADNGLGDWVNLSASIMELTQTSLGSIRGDSEFLIQKKTAFGGMYVYIPFSIDPADTGNTLYITADILPDASYVSGDFQIKIISGDLNEEYYVKNKDISSSNNHIASFQADPSKVDYYLRIVGVSTAITEISIDNIQIGPRELVTGVGKTSWSTIIDISLDINEHLNEGGAFLSVTQPSTGHYRFYYNSGLFPSSPIITSTLKVPDGSGPTSSRIAGEGIDGTGSFFDIRAMNSSGAATNLTGTDILQVTVRQKEEDIDSYRISTILDSRDIALQSSGCAGETVSSDNPIPFIATSDTAGSWDGTRFTAPMDGYYDYNGSMQYTVSASESIREFIDGSATKIISAVASTTRRVFGNSVYLKAGQILDIRLQASRTFVNTTSAHYLNITRRQSPQTLLGQQRGVTVLKRVVTASESTTAGANARIITDIDGFDAVISGNGFIPRQGKYKATLITSMYRSNHFKLYLYNVDTSTYVTLDTPQCYANITNSSVVTTASTELTFEANGSDVYEFRIWCESSVVAGYTGSVAARAGDPAGTNVMSSSIILDRIY